MPMARRILGRAELTAREVYTLRGILRLIDYHNRRGRNPGDLWIERKLALPGKVKTVAQT